MYLCVRERRGNDILYLVYMKLDDWRTSFCLLAGRNLKLKSCAPDYRSYGDWECKFGSMAVQMHPNFPGCAQSEQYQDLSSNRFDVADTIPETRKVLHRITETFNCPRERPAWLVVLV